MDVEFRLADRIDWDALRAHFRHQRRLEIPDVLADGQAEILRTHLCSRKDWKLVLNAGDKVYELSREAVANLSTAQRRDLDQHVVHAGRTGFQYRYESIRAPDGGSAGGDDLVSRFVAFLSSTPVIDRLNYVLGGSASFADGQATSYGKGHFLTCHDDDVAGKNRQAAYVFSLTPAWRPEWGGLLMFHDDKGNIEQGFAPQMGALRLFSVPQRHSVSYITPFAPEPRLSITGWLRSAVA